MGIQQQSHIVPGRVVVSGSESDCMELLANSGNWPWVVATVRFLLEMVARWFRPKILQNSDFAKKQDLNPVPNGGVAAHIAKKLQKSFFELKNKIFAKI
jgi:hypothetical protein